MQGDCSTEDTKDLQTRVKSNYIYTVVLKTLIQNTNSRISKCKSMYVERQLYNLLEKYDEKVTVYVAVDTVVLVFV